MMFSDLQIGDLLLWSVIDLWAGSKIYVYCILHKTDDNITFFSQLEQSIYIERKMCEIPKNVSVIRGVFYNEL